MFRACWFLVQLLLLAPAAVVAQQTSDPVTQALAQGDTYRNKKRYDLALESYHKADVIRPPSEIMVKGHQFVRADLVHNAGRNQLYRAFVQTLAAGYLVSINFYASSAEELETLAASLQSISIEESP